MSNLTTIGITGGVGTSGTGTVSTIDALLAASAPLGPASAANSVPVIQASDYPSNAVPVAASATGTTGAVTATLAAAASKNTFLCGFVICTSANAATVVAPTVTGAVGGTVTFSQYVPVNTAGVDRMIIQFKTPLVSTTVNTAIAVISGAAGTGGVTTVYAYGYQL